MEPFPDRPSPQDRPVVASAECPACRSGELATLEIVTGYAHARIEEGRLVWLGTTDLDWNGSETVRTPDGIVLSCLTCDHEWVHPSLSLEL